MEDSAFAKVVGHEHGLVFAGAVSHARICRCRSKDVSAGNRSSQAAVDFIMGMKPRFRHPSCDGMGLVSHSDLEVVFVRVNRSAI